MCCQVGKAIDRCLKRHCPDPMREHLLGLERHRQLPHEKNPFAFKFRKAANGAIDDIFIIDPKVRRGRADGANIPRRRLESFALAQS